MNHVYRLLWNGTIGAWVAVSEHAKSSGKKSSTKIRAPVCALIIGGGMSLNANAYSVAGADICADTIDKIGVGQHAKACSSNSIAVGAGSITSGDAGISIGAGAQVAADQAISIGAGSQATDKRSISLGYLTKTTAEGAIALGWSADASGVYSTAIGNGANASGSRSYAIGNSTKSSGLRSFAIGTSAIASGIDSLAFGTALADKDRSVAIGFQSLTTTDATQQASITQNGLTYGDFAGQVTDVGMQVSIGVVGKERQIKNVGSGEISETSTDAINGSQLYATNAVLGNVSNSIVATLGGNATLNPDGSINMTDIGGTGQNTIHSAILASQEETTGGTNVSSVTSTTGANGQTIYTVNADGASVSAGSSALNVVAGAKDANNVTDYAVDLSQETKASLVKADTALQSVITQIDGVDVKTVSKDDNSANFVTGTNIQLEDDGTGGIRVSTADDVTFTNVTTTNLTSTGTTQLGDSFTVNTGGSYYTGPVTEGDHITNKSYVDQTAAGSRTEVEQGKNIRVTSETGVDGQTVYTVSTTDEVDFNKVTVGDTKITTDGVVIANGPSLTNEGISAGGKKVTDVADGVIGADSKDAINGGQLHAIGTNVTQLFGGNAIYGNNQITWSNIGGTGQNTIDDAIKHVNNQVINANQGWNVSTDSGSNATSTIKPGQTVNINGNSENGVLVTNSGNDIKVSLSDQIKIGSGDNAVSIDGNAGTIQVGDVLIDGSKGNVTAGKVNINGEVGTVNGLTNTTWNPEDIVSGQAATEDQLQQVAKNATAAATAAKTTVTAGDNITVAMSKNTDGSTNYQVATSKDVEFDTVTSSSVTADKITVGSVTIDQAGINAGGNKVTNVADGVISSTSKDAINGSQLNASNTNIYNYLGGGANYDTNTGPTYNVGGGSHNNVGDALTSLDQKVTNVSNQLEQAFYTTNKRIDDVENRANAGNAQALATAGLPQAYIPGKSMMAISGGTYRGETGYAIGMSSISDNGKWVFKVTGSGNSRGDFGGTVGGGIQW